jgi:hypothetical protein
LRGFGCLNCSYNKIRGRWIRRRLVRRVIVGIFAVFDFDVAECLTIVLARYPIGWVT